ncbi:MAG: RagB/SusD family nutrient uptake outer membrane protein [Chitinophagales bacterium]|nr:RagB/SusD family nutrient uptake outer membrane protein [Chitinophagales bacterium]
MKNFEFNKLLIVFCIIALSEISCKKFLDYTPKGNLSEEQIREPQNAEALVTAAYATLDNSIWFVPYGNLWGYGDVRSDDSYKGGLGQADEGDFNSIELFTLLRPENVRNSMMWQRIYIAISRVNLALSSLNNLTDEEFPKKEQRIAEMRFLRGHYYFLLEMLYKHIPYVDETMSNDAIDSLSNREFTQDQIWDKIAGDFKQAMNVLPANQDQVGRPTKYAAEAYLAKTRLFQAYEQDEQNQVININSQHLDEVISLTNDIILSGKYNLFADYANNFIQGFDNGIESIFAIQHSINDGTPSGRVDRDNALNYTMNPEYGCCSFNRPSQNLVNAFQTNSDGLPLFTTFNDFELNKEADFQSHSFDPRLDHTIGLPGHPFKYQNSMIYVPADFTRSPGIYGPFSGMKPAQLTDCGCMVKLPGSAFVGTSKNTDIIRFDEVLLWNAEALIQTGRQNEALPIINRIRQRAGESTNRLKYDNGGSYSNYHINLYKDGVNINWDKDNALQALQWEYRLETAMEGKRFFNLVRWGKAEQVMNEYLNKEKVRFQFLSPAKFTAGRDEYLPIPEVEIELSNRKYIQNVGY